MTTNNIFGNDILSGDLNTSLVPELGDEDLSFDITYRNSSFIDPLTQELSLIELETEDLSEDNINRNSSSNNFQFANRISFANIDPFVASNAQEFQVNNTSFAPNQSQLTFQGGFGDYNGGNDVTFEVKNEDGAVVETYSLKGEGQATLYRDEEFQYVFFSGTNETTKVDISSVSNIKFGNYIGDSLKIETSGSIEGSEIILYESDETGLILESGIESEENLIYTITKLEGFYSDGNSYRKHLDINNFGQIIGKTGNKMFQLYLNGEVEVFGSTPIRSYAPVAINDLGQVIGNSSLGPFVYSNGETQFLPLDHISQVKDINNSGQVTGELSFNEPGEHGSKAPRISSDGVVSYLQPFSIKPSYDQEGNFLHTYQYAIGNSINDSGVIAGSSNFCPPNDSCIRTAFISNGNQIKSLGYLDDGNRYSHATSINNLDQVVGYSFANDKNDKEAFFYDNGKMKSLGLLPGYNDSHAMDINDLGQIVGTLQINNVYTDNTGFIYQNGQMLNLNNLIPENSGWTLDKPKAINNKGQIVGFGTYNNISDVAFLLNPITTASESKITVGNITTFGDTVLLQGEEIILNRNAITTNGGEIKLDGTTKVGSNITIDTSVIEDEEVTGGGDITFTGTLDSETATTNNLKLQAGTGNILFSDVVGGEATLNNINIKGANTVTVEADITSNGLIKINATEDIIAKNITSEKGRVELISEEKSITAEDITTKNPEGKNIVLEAIEGIDVGKLDAGELGKVNITSGEVEDNDTETLEDDTVIVGDVITGDITAKQVSVLSTGSFDAIGDITAHDGKVEITAINNINTRGINSLTKSIRVISTEGAVTVEGDLNSEKNGIAITAKDDITTKKIRSFDGVIGLSSYDGSVIVEDDINTVEGGVVIAGKQSVDVANIDTGIGEVNIGSGGDIDVNGTITTNVGYVSIVTNENIDAQSISTNKGFVEVAAGEIATASISTGNGVSTLISAADLDDGVLVATNPGTDLTSSFEKPADLSEEQKETLGEFIEDLWYRTPRLGKFITGALYQWGLDNGEEIRFFLPKSLKLSKKEDALLDAILNESDAFELGRLAGSGASIAQGILEFIAGQGLTGGGGGLCITGIGCFAGAPAIATGVALQVHGAKLAVTSADDFGSRLSDILSPNRMASSSADDINALGKETGIDPAIIGKVYGDLGRNGDGIRLLDEKLGTGLTENLFSKGGDGGTGSQLVKDVADLIGRFSNKLVGNKLVDDVDAIADVQRTLSANRPNKKGDINITDTQLKQAFSDNVSFLQKYKDRVSGAFSYTFGRARSTALDFNQAQGEINLAEDLLDGKAFLKNDGSGQSFLSNVDHLRAPSDLPKLGGNPKTPDYFMTSSDGVTRLVEIKTPTKKLRADRLRNSLGEATKQIRDNSTISNPNSKGIIRLDYRSSALPADLSTSEVENIVKIRMNNFLNAEKTLKGSDFIDFVEVIYKDANNSNIIQTVVVKIN